MITMKNWHVCVPECDQSIGYDGENLVYRLQIETDSPPDWAYKLDLRYLDGQKNYLELIYTDGVLYVDILRDYLRPGSVKAQIRALNGEQEKHSNQFDLFVQLSINAPDAFEMTEPSAFAQLEQRLTGLKQDTETAAGNAAESADAARESAQDAAESREQSGVSAQAAEASRQAAARIVSEGQTVIRTEGDTQAERLQADADAHMEQLRETSAAALADIDKAVDTKLEQAEGAANAAKDAQGAAELAATRQPYPDPVTKTWWRWSAETGGYIDTGEPYRGNVLIPTFDLDPTTGDLIMTEPDEPTGLEFRINDDGELEVSINNG